MAAPSNRLYIFVSICCFMVIPLGLLAPKVGPKLIDAWKYRKLGRPIPQRGRVVRYFWASGSGGQVSRRLDLAGQVTREWPATGECYAAELLANGNLLYPDGQRQQLVELNPAGETVWTAAPGVINIYDLTRLANGHTLYASAYGSQRAVELDEQGRAVWSFAGLIFSAQRLANGDTLLADNSVVWEVTPAGTVVWAKTDLRGVAHARRLTNGNTLVADWSGNRVVEFDREGREVWNFACPCPFSAERLPDGKTLVAHRTPDELLLVSPNGTSRVLAAGLAGGKAQPIYAGR